MYKERKRIDIHITNGNQHIIIENKIWAGDQPQQIQRYIDKIVKEQSLESSDIDSNDDMESSESETKQVNKVYENIAVLYLAPHTREPLDSSLGKWQIQGNSLVDNKGNKVRFKVITYKEEILKWIENSQAKVGCITHLNSALYFYKDVVQIITKTKENTMNMAKFLTGNKENMQENIRIVSEILENQNEIIESYCEAFVEKHKKQIEGKGFEIFINKEWRLGGKYYNLVIRPKEHNKVYMAFCVTKSRGKLYHSIELFYPYNEEEHNNNAKYNEYNNEVIGKMSKQGMKFQAWFHLSWTYSFSTFEKELQRFLDDTEQKKWNKQIEKALQSGLSKIIEGADKD